jgi:uncharacterized Fe-S cluster protein YjdI
MIVRKAHIKDGVVINISIGDTEKPWVPPDGIEIVTITDELSENCTIGSTWDGKMFTRPLDPIIIPVKTIDEKLAEILDSVNKLTADIVKIQNDVDILKSKP